MVAESPLIYYFHAKRVVYENGYFSEVYFQEKISLQMLNKSDFYREYAWVVLSSGMSEKVIKRIFENLSLVFNNWKNPVLIIKNRRKIYNRAVQIFNNHTKINALFEMAAYLCKKTCSDVVNLIQTRGAEYLMNFKFLGPATSLHLAKNLGINVAKPDRHLMRIANLFGYTCANSLCEKIASFTGEKKSVVDIVLWRYATLNKNYLSIPNA
jgi:hypothetical protein